MKNLFLFFGWQPWRQDALQAAVKRNPMNSLIVQMMENSKLLQQYSRNMTE